MIRCGIRYGCLTALILFVFSPLSLSSAQGRIPIQPNNVDHLTEQTMLGRGTASKLGWSPDGNSLIALTGVGAWIYALSDLTSSPQFVKIPTAGATFARDYSRLAVVQNQAIQIWDTLSWELAPAVVDFPERISSLAFVPNSPYLVVGSYDNNAQVVDIMSGKIMARFDTSSAVYTVDVSPDGSLIATAGEEYNHIRLWSLHTHQFIRDLEIDDPQALYEVGDISFSSDGRQLAAARGCCSVQVFDTTTGAVIPSSSNGLADPVPPYEAYHVGFSTNGHWFAAQGRHMITLWNARNYRTTLRVGGNTIVSFALHPNKPLMVMSDHAGVHLIDLTTGQTSATLEMHFPAPRSAAFSPDGAVLAVTYFDGRTRLWDTASGQLLATFFRDPNHAVDYLAFSPDGSLLAVTTGYSSTDVLILNSTTGEVITTLKTTDSSYDVAFNRQGTQLAVAEWGEFTVWDAQTYEELLAWGYFMGSISIAFSPDGSLLAVGFIGSPRPSLYLFWDITRESHEGNAFGWFSTAGATSVAINADSSRLASGDCNEIHLWDISTQNKILQLNANSRPLVSLGGHSACVEKLLYTPDSSLLISAANPEIYLWNTSDYSIIRILWGSDFTMSQDGTQLAVITSGVVQLWAISE